MARGTPSGRLTRSVRCVLPLSWRAEPEPEDPWQVRVTRRTVIRMRICRMSPVMDLPLGTSTRSTNAAAGRPPWQQDRGVR